VIELHLFSTVRLNTFTIKQHTAYRCGKRKVPEHQKLVDNNRYFY
ncbi:unnamed protein product, partial [Rotaria socialis]